MSDRALPLLLDDIATAIRYILAFTEEMDSDQYEADMKTRYAVERNFEIIGEAVARISQEFKL
jgi:uncharacterized protein with HEPN domain